MKLNLTNLTFLIFLILATTVSADCLELFDGLEIKNNTLLCSKTYDLPNGILIKTSNLVLDCNTAIIRGFDGKGIGIKIEHADNVTIRNCHVLTFDIGFFLKNVTNSLIEQNGIFKNRIGIRMLDSFENIIRENNDKSHEFAVSSVGGKYNVVMHGNKNVERGFCEFNACNRLRDMNVCESGDFYCSKKCSPETDKDCGNFETKTVSAEPVQEFPLDVGEVSEIKIEKLEPSEKRIPLWTKLVIYLTAYLIVLAIVKLRK